MASNRSHMSVAPHHADLSPWLGLLGAAFGQNTPEVDPEYVAAAQDYYENGGNFSTPELKAKFQTGSMYKKPGFLGTMSGNPANEYNAETKQRALLTQMAQGGQVNMMAQENAIKAKEAPQVDPRFLELNAVAGGKPRGAVSPDLAMDFDNPELQLPFIDSNSGGKLGNAKFLTDREEKRQTQEFNSKEDTKRAINSVLSKNGLIPTPSNISRYDDTTSSNAIGAANSEFASAPIKAKMETTKALQLTKFIEENPTFLGDEQKAKLAEVLANTEHIGATTAKARKTINDVQEGTFRPIGETGQFQYFGGPKIEETDVVKTLKAPSGKSIEFPSTEKRIVPAGIHTVGEKAPRRISANNPFAPKSSNTNSVPTAQALTPLSSAPVAAKSLTAYPTRATALDPQEENKVNLQQSYYQYFLNKGLSPENAAIAAREAFLNDQRNK